MATGPHTGEDRREKQTDIHLHRRRGDSGFAWHLTLALVTGFASVTIANWRVPTSFEVIQLKVRQDQVLLWVEKHEAEFHALQARNYWKYSQDGVPSLGRKDPRANGVAEL